MKGTSSLYCNIGKVPVVETVFASLIVLMSPPSCSVGAAMTTGNRLQLVLGANVLSREAN